MTIGDRRRRLIYQGMTPGPLPTTLASTPSGRPVSARSAPAKCETAHMGFPKQQPVDERLARPIRQRADEARGGPVVDPAAPLIFVVDDDVSVRTSLSRLFRSVGLQVEMFGSASELLQRLREIRPHCLVLDIRLPGVSGLELQRQLRASQTHTPIVFMTGHGDIPMSVRAMKAGAFDFLAKPFHDQDMLDAVAAAVQRDKLTRQADDAEAKLRAVYKLLSERQREVMALVTSGLLNKQIAARLGVSEITVKIHRRNLMQRVQAKSLPDLVRMAESLGIHESAPSPDVPTRAERTQKGGFS
jgi:FixJ family two-component response regulator